MDFGTLFPFVVFLALVPESDMVSCLQRAPSSGEAGEWFSVDNTGWGDLSVLCMWAREASSKWRRPGRIPTEMACRAARIISSGRFWWILCEGVQKQNDVVRCA